MLADLREALRQLRNAPGVTSAAVLTLALGIGATTAIFTLVDRVMLKSLPVAKPEELWRIRGKVRCCSRGGYTQGDDGDFSLFSWEAYKNFRAQTPEFVRSDKIWSHSLSNIVLWAPGNSAEIEERVRKALASVDPNLVLYGVDPYSKVVSADFQQQRLVAMLTTLFGALALVLAAVGLFGVMAYMVERRTGEIGVRMALGADRGRVVGMVLAGAFRQVSVGLGIGIPAAIGAGKLMTVQLFGVQPWDPFLLTIATLSLGVGALVASIIPAWRAACVEPMAALRTE